MRARITTRQAKKATLTTASAATGIATMSAVAPRGVWQMLFIGGSWLFGTAALFAATIWLLRLLRARATVVIKIEPATEADLPGLRSFAVSHFGDEVTKLHRIQTWWSRNPTMFATVKSETHLGNRKIVDLEGYFAALPLRAEAAAEVGSEHKGINDLEAHDLCATNEVPAGVYVGAVVADSEAASSAAMQGLVAMLKRMIRGRGDLWVMARPVTPDGLRLVQAFGMEPVRIADDPMGVLHRTKASNLLPIRRRRQRSKRSSKCSADAG